MRQCDGVATHVLMDLTSCHAPTPTYSATRRADSCVPITFDPSAPEWGGAFERVTFEGTADPIGWLSERPWLWRRLHAAVAWLTRTIVDRYGVEPTFVLDVSWDEGKPGAWLRCRAPVFPFVYPGYDSRVDDAEAAVLFVDDGARYHPVVGDLEHCRFDGCDVFGVWVGLSLMAYEGEDVAPRLVRLAGPPVPAEDFEREVQGPSLVETMRTTLEDAAQRDMMRTIDPDGAHR